MDIEKLRSSLNSGPRQSKELSSLLQRSASPKNHTRGAEQNKEQINMKVLEEFDCREIDSGSKNSLDRIMATQNILNQISEESVNPESEDRHAGRSLKSEPKRQHNIEELMSSSNKKTIYRTGEKIRIFGESTPVKSLARTRNSNSHRDLSRSPLEEKLDEGVLRRYQRGGPESKKLDFELKESNTSQVVQKIEILEDKLPEPRSAIFRTLVPELGIPRASKSGDNDRPVVQSLSNSSDTISNSEDSLSESQEQTIFYVKKSQRTIVNLVQNQVPLISIYYSDELNRLAVPLMSPPSHTEAGIGPILLERFFIKTMYRFEIANVQFYRQAACAMAVRKQSVEGRPAKSNSHPIQLTDEDR